jgi:hypothetical protein
MRINNAQPNARRTRPYRFITCAPMAASGPASGLLAVKFEARCRGSNGGRHGDFRSQANGSPSPVSCQARSAPSAEEANRIADWHLHTAILPRTVPQIVCSLAGKKPLATSVAKSCAAVRRGEWRSACCFAFVEAIRDIIGMQEWHMKPRRCRRGRLPSRPSPQGVKVPAVTSANVGVVAPGGRRRPGQRRSRRDTGAAWL